MGRGSYAGYKALIGQQLSLIMSKKKKTTGGEAAVNIFLVFDCGRLV